MLHQCPLVAGERSENEEIHEIKSRMRKTPSASCPALFPRGRRNGTHPQSSADRSWGGGHQTVCEAGPGNVNMIAGILRTHWRKQVSTGWASLPRKTQIPNDPKSETFWESTPSLKWKNPYFTLVAMVWTQNRDLKILHNITFRLCA